MNRSFSINTKKKQENIYIDLAGEFDENAAWKLANAVLTRFDEKGKIFIDARNIHRVIPFGAEMINHLIPAMIIPRKKILIRDRQGCHNGFKHFRNMARSPAAVAIPTVGRLGSKTAFLCKQGHHSAS